MSEVGARILKQLSEGRVFSIRPEDDSFIITEGCDQYFDLELNKTELRELGLVLIAMADAP